MFNASLFGVFSDSAIHRFGENNQEELVEIQNQIIEHMLDQKKKIFSIQNICAKAGENYNCRVGDFYSPVVIMNCIKQIARENKNKK
jgi:predicted nucleic-acid-binding protein